MKLGTFIVLATTLIATSTAFASSETRDPTGRMGNVRARAMAKIRTENLQSMQSSLHEAQVTLRDDTRARFLAQLPSPACDDSSVRAAR